MGDRSKYSLVPQSLNASNNLLKESLLLNAFSCATNGLNQGKAGFAVVLLEMATALNDERLEGQALDLLQQALVYCPSVVSYAHGATGIGLALLYLIDNGFVDGDYMELFGERHKEILESLLSEKMKFQNMQDCSGIGLFIHTARPYISDNDFLLINEKLKKFFTAKCNSFASMDAPSVNNEEFYQGAALQLKYEKDSVSDIIRVCNAWQKRNIICESLELGVELLKVGKEQGLTDVNELGRRLIETAVLNKNPLRMSLREKINYLYFTTIRTDLPLLSEIHKLKEQLINELLLSDSSQLEKNIVSSVWNHTLYCGLDNGVSRLLLLHLYWERLNSDEHYTQIDNFFY